MSFVVDMRGNVGSVSANGRRPYSTYTKGRKSLSEEFCTPVSGREWWRFYLKETPAPGAYETRGFVDDLNGGPVRHTYNFKGSGRKRDIKAVKGGEVLLPGAYNHHDFLHYVSVRPSTYRFKGPGRKPVLAGYMDKECNVPPNHYKTERQLIRKQPISSGNFKSQSARFPTKYFKPKEGPSPGSYEPKDLFKSTVVSSSFKSRTPRFASSRTKVPAPGIYAPSIQSPQSKTILRMGKLHGLYFKNSFEI